MVFYKAGHNVSIALDQQYTTHQLPVTTGELNVVSSFSLGGTLQRRSPRKLELTIWDPFMSYDVLEFLEKIKGVPGRDTIRDLLP